MDDFLTRVVLDGLVTSTQLEDTRRRVARICRDIPPTRWVWADVFVRLGHLTPYQAQSLLAGASPAVSIDGYDILEEVGRGGLNPVLRARQRGNQDEVAVKILPDHLADKVTLVRHWRQRLERASRLDHPNIVHVRKADWADEHSPVVVRDFVAGADAHALTRRRGRLPAGEVLDIGRGVCDALAYAHQMGLAHRNVKPENILVGEDGRAQLADFGVVRLNASSELGALGQFERLWDYVAPEQVLDPTRIDPRADLYSLGCSLYHMTTGRRPFPESGLSAKLVAHQAKTPPDPRLWAPDTSEGMVRVLRKLMAKKPADRFQSAADAAEALRHVTSNRIPCTSAGFDLSRWQPAGRSVMQRRRRRRAVKRWLAVGAAAALGYMSWLAFLG